MLRENLEAPMYSCAAVCSMLEALLKAGSCVSLTSTLEDARFGKLTGIYSGISVPYFAIAGCDREGARRPSRPKTPKPQIKSPD